MRLYSISPISNSSFCPSIFDKHIRVSIRLRELIATDSQINPFLS